MLRPETKVIFCAPLCSFRVFVYIIYNSERANNCLLKKGEAKKGNFFKRKPRANRERTPA